VEGSHGWRRCGQGIVVRDGKPGRGYDSVVVERGCIVRWKARKLGLRETLGSRVTVVSVVSPAVQVTQNHGLQPLCASCCVMLLRTEHRVGVKDGVGVEDGVLC
jgi:hypothetical protein